MGKYTTGLDWSAVATMIGAIEELHSCRVECRVQTVGQAHNGRLDIEFVAHFSVVPGSDLPREVRVKHVWPTKTASNMEGLWYNLAWQLDYAIQKAYEQLSLTPKE